MGLQDKLLEDMKAAMKSGDKTTLGTIRMIRAQVQNAALSKGEALSDEDILVVLNKEAKKRKEAIELYTQGEREDLIQKETEELKIITSYLPEMLSEEEIAGIVEEAIKETGAETMSDMGKVMGIVMPKVKGRADGKVINEIVRKKLS